MKKIVYLVAVFMVGNACTTYAQMPNIKKGLEKVATVKPATSALTEDEVARGLKEALNNGIEKGVSQLSKPDGYFKDPQIKIPMPAEAKQVEEKLRKLGQGKKVDEAVESINRAAEDAASGVGDIFWTSIKQMSIQDGVKILNGNDVAATSYLQKTTTTELTQKFKPVIDASLIKTDATKYWNDVFSNYNRFSKDKVNPDLTAYVTEKALAGLFLNIGIQEQKIRKDPSAQVTGILKKVFGGDKNASEEQNTKA
jgi:nitrogen regulatory protein PII